MDAKEFLNKNNYCKLWRGEDENGSYIYYDTEVEKAMEDYHNFKLKLFVVSQQRELLSDFMGYLLKNGYLNRRNLKDFIVQDYLISLNCG